MTINEAIRLTRKQMGVIMSEKYPDKQTCEALNMAITALREKEERDNPKLLTMDELKKMNGEPVWVVELNYWAVVTVLEGGRWDDGIYVCTRIGSVSYEWDAEIRNLHCYRHKPKENVK